MPEELQKFLTSVVVVTVIAFAVELVLTVPVLLVLAVHKAW